MNKKNTGLLIGAGAGLGLVWLIRRGLLDRLPFDVFPPLDREIVLTEDSPGHCRVTVKPKEAWLVTAQKLTWHVTNNCTADHTVSLRNWDDGHGDYFPAVDPVEDPNDPGQDGLSRHIKAGKKGKIRSKAKMPDRPWQTFTYDVFVDGEAAADPIVKLVL